MSRKGLLIVLVVILTALFAQAAAPVQAYATVTATAATCGSFYAEGTTSAPYVTVYAYNMDTGGEWWAYFPVVGGSFANAITFPEAPAGTMFNYEVWGTLAPYTDFSDPLYWDGEDWYSANAPCVPAVPGPSIPAGFEQYNIVCDTPVYSEPGGALVPDSLILAGQDWHIDPVPVTGADGGLWHEIFVGSYQDGFIPAACVGTPTEFD